MLLEIFNHIFPPFFHSVLENQWRWEHSYKIYDVIFVFYDFVMINHTKKQNDTENNESDLQCDHLKENESHHQNQYKSSEELKTRYDTWSVFYFLFFMCMKSYCSNPPVSHVFRCVFPVKFHQKIIYCLNFSIKIIECD